MDTLTKKKKQYKHEENLPKVRLLYGDPEMAFSVCVADFLVGDFVVDDL
jgi:hypothetical protein